MHSVCFAQREHGGQFPLLCFFSRQNCLNSTGQETKDSLAIERTWGAAPEEFLTVYLV